MTFGLKPLGAIRPALLMAQKTAPSVTLASLNQTAAASKLPLLASYHPSESSFDNPRETRMLRVLEAKASAGEIPMSLTS
jgi:hypothetical protein